MSEKKEFPKFIYNIFGEAALLRTEADKDELGGEWKESPAHFTDEQKSEALKQKLSEESQSEKRSKKKKEVVE